MKIAKFFRLAILLLLVFSANPAFADIGLNVRTPISSSGQANENVIYGNATSWGTGGNSLLLLQLQGAERFKVDKDGNLTLPGQISTVRSNNICNAAGANCFQPGVGIDTTPDTIADNGSITLGTETTGTYDSTADTIADDGVISSAEVNFNYANSGSKGGGASDVACTNCVTMGTETTGAYDSTDDSWSGTSLNSVSVNGTAGRNYFKDSEKSDGSGLRVGAAWGMYGVYAETGAGVLGGVNGANLQNGALVVNTSGNVGIGTNNATSKLTVSGNIDGAGGLARFDMVGVGNIWPSYDLDVLGTTRLSGQLDVQNTSGINSSFQGNVIFYDNVGIGTNSNHGAPLEVIGSGIAPNELPAGVYVNAGAATGVMVVSSGGEGVEVFSSGWGGVGITSESEDLAISGKGGNTGVYGEGGSFGLYGSSNFIDIFSDGMGTYGFYEEGLAPNYFEGRVGAGSTAWIGNEELLVQNDSDGPQMFVRRNNSIKLAALAVVADNVNAQATISMNGTGRSTPAANTMVVQNAGSGQNGISFQVGGTYAMQISSTGNVGIGMGAAFPTWRLQVRGQGTTASTYGLVVEKSNGVNNMYIRDDGFGYLAGSSWSYGSDRRLKENIRYFNDAKINALDYIGKLRPASFDYIDGTKKESGFIAQDVQTVLPDLVTVNKEGMLGLKTDNLIPYLVKGMQEQQAQIEDQQNQLDIQQKEIDLLKETISSLKK